jgi:hypothetical protein
VGCAESTASISTSDMSGIEPRSPQHGSVSTPIPKPEGLTFDSPGRKPWDNAAGDREPRWGGSEISLMIEARPDGAREAAIVLTRGLRPGLTTTAASRLKGTALATPPRAAETTRWHVEVFTVSFVSRSEPHAAHAPHATHAAHASHAAARAGPGGLLGFGLGRDDAVGGQEDRRDAAGVDEGEAVDLGGGDDALGDEVAVFQREGVEPEVALAFFDLADDDRALLTFMPAA